MTLALAVFGLLGGAPSRAQGPGDGPERLLDRFQDAVTSGDTELFSSLFVRAMDEAEVAYYRDEVLRPGVVRRVVRDRARLPLGGAAAADGLRVAVDIFEESARDARLLTTSFEIRRGDDGGDDWRIAAVDGLSALEGLYRLHLDTSIQYDPAGLQIEAPDLRLTLESGALFAIDSAAGITGLVFTGRGRMEFSPEPEGERRQLQLFAGSPTLDTAFETLLVRFHPSDLDRLVGPAPLRAGPVDARAARRAEDVARRELANSYVVDVSDVSAEQWHLLPGVSDVLAEIRTRRHGTLTYSWIHGRAEDVSLVRRDRQLTVALYTSAAYVPVFGRSYNEEDLREYDVLDYAIDASIAPNHRQLQARARLDLRVLRPISSLTLRLAESLAVYRVASPELGPLGFVRVQGQHAVFVRLPRTLPAETPLTLEISYAGTVRSQPIDAERMQDVIEPPFWSPEPRLLLSQGSDWYPQNVYTDLATATLRIDPPAGRAVVATGDRIAQPGESGPGTAGASEGDGVRWEFRAARPLRYLALLVSRLDPVETRTLALDTGGTAGSAPLRMDVLSNPIQSGRARDLADAMEDVLRFYASLVGDVPYPSAALAVVDSTLPGGHSPGYFMMLQNPFTTSPQVWRRDPAAFPAFPEFFLAHELAHQWWGQAVGIRNYRERWISEGFAQYFAAMYAEHARGEATLHDMLNDFRRWSLSESEMGPVSLGGRLGHVEGGGRVFRALVYNKGAAVLHMLRRMVGDEVFVRALRRFYGDHRFGVAGTDDLQHAFEVETGASFERFFERWIRGTAVPRVIATTSVDAGSVRVRLEQVSDGVFDLPVTVSVVYRDGRVDDVVMVMKAKELERTIPADGEVRRVEVNRDSAALAEFRGP